MVTDVSVGRKQYNKRKKREEKRAEERTHKAKTLKTTLKYSNFIIQSPMIT